MLLDNSEIYTISFLELDKKGWGWKFLQVPVEEYTIISQSKKDYIEESVSKLIYEQINILNGIGVPRTLRKKAEALYREKWKKQSILLRAELLSLLQD